MAQVKPNTSIAARKAAQENADYFRRPYGYFQSTSLGWQVERWESCKKVSGATRVDPKSEKS